MSTDPKKELMQQMMEIEYYKPEDLTTIDLKEKQKIPLAKLSALGIAFEPLVQAFQSITHTGQGGSGLYWVNTGGKTMHTFNDKPGFLGSLKSPNGGVGGGQAVLNPLAFNPAMLCVAAAVMRIENKLDAIQELQKEILAFLELKEEAKIKGNLNTLIDVLTNYKYNCDNKTYKDHKHILVQEIKRDAEQNIILYREQLEKALKKQGFLFIGNDPNKFLAEASKLLNNYQLTLYTLSFSSFLEVMLLENFDAGYLDSIVAKIEEYSEKYKKIYQSCCEKFEKDSQHTLQNYATKSLSGVSWFTGKVVEKIPVISNSQLDETLIEAGETLGKLNENQIKKTLNVLSESQLDYIGPFVENIQSVKQLYNEPLDLLFDNENLYIGAAK